MFDIVYPTYKEIIQTIEESAISRLFLGMEYGKKYPSLFRKDPTPSAGLYYSRNGRLRYNDFIQNLTIPSAIMKLNNWDYQQFLESVCGQFGLTKDSINAVSKVPYRGDLEEFIKSQKETSIHIKRREFNNKDLEFWSKFAISKETLELYNVFAISHYWINDKLINGSNFSYSYDFYWENDIFRRKIYQPFDKRFKWFSNGGKICQGEINMPNSGELLIVTKSLKDAMTLHELGYQGVAPPSESTFLPEEYFLKQKERFKRIVIWYDNDFDKEFNTGQSKGLEFSEQYNIENIYIPSIYETKDISDYVAKYGKEQSINLIKSLI